MSFRNIKDEGIQPVATAAERLALLPPDGTVVVQLDTHELYVYDAIANTWTQVGTGVGIYLPLAGGTMTGTLTLDAAFQTGTNDAATLGQVQQFVNGLIWKSPAADAAFSANVNIALPGVLTSGLYTAVNGDTILLTGQIVSADNGIYIYNGAGFAMTRRSDANSSSELDAATIVVTQGTFAGLAFTQTFPSPVIGVDPISFVTVGNSYTAGSGLGLLGNQFSIATGGIVDSMVSASAAIAYSKLNLTNSIVNNDVSASAAIAYSKLNLTNSIVNADVSASAAVAYSKLNLTNSIVNADVSPSAAVAYSKLNLTNSIVNADVSPSAAIDGSKIVPNFGSQSITTTLDVNAANYTITATNNGYLEMRNQVSDPLAPASNRIRLFSDSLSQFSLKGSAGFSGKFSLSALSGDRTFTLPNFSGTLVTESGIQTLSKKTLIDGIIIGNQNLADAPIIQTSASPNFGDMYYTDAGNKMAQIPIGKVGYALKSASFGANAGPQWQPDLLNLQYFSQQIDDFIGPNMPFWTSNNTGMDTNAIALTPVVGIFPYNGVYTLTTPASSTANSGRVGHGQHRPLTMGGNFARYIFETRVLVSALSSVSSRYTATFGLFGGNNPALGTNFFVITYTDNINGGRWQISRGDGSGSAVTDTGVTVVANTWYRLTLEYNAAGTSVSVSINGTLVAIVNTFIPSGSAAGMGLNFQMNKAATANAATVSSYWDYLSMSVEFGTSRQ